MKEKVTLLDRLPPREESSSAYWRVLKGTQFAYLQVPDQWSEKDIQLCEGWGKRLSKKDNTVYFPAVGKELELNIVIDMTKGK